MGQIPSLAGFPTTLQGLIAGGLRHQLANPNLSANPLRQSVGSTDPHSSRESNSGSSAEDSGQFSPTAEAAKIAKSQNLANQTANSIDSKKPSDPTSPNRSSITPERPIPTPIDVNQNFAKALANLPPTLQSRLGPYMEESMKMLQQKMALAHQIEAQKRKFDQPSE